MNFQKKIVNSTDGDYFPEGIPQTKVCSSQPVLKSFMVSSALAVVANRKVIRIKSFTTVNIWKEFPELRRYYWYKNHLWSIVILLKILSDANKCYSFFQGFLIKITEEILMKLSQWAKQQGISYLTAWRWFQENKLPVAAYKVPSGSIYVKDNIENQDEYKNVYIYARVSTSERKQCLETQVTRCLDYASQHGITVDKIEKEVASGMNDKRVKLTKMLNDKPSLIIIENKDRLTRFGFNYLKLLLEKLNCDIIVLNEEDNEEKELMKDLISIITSFCCRLYGLRRGKNKIRKMKEQLTSD